MFFLFQFSFRLCFCHSSHIRFIRERS